MPQMSEGVYKTNGNIMKCDKVCNGAPDGRFGKLFLIRDAKNFDKSPKTIYFK